MDQTEKTPLDILRSRLSVYANQNPKTKQGFKTSNKTSLIATITFSSKELFEYAKKTTTVTGQP